MSFGSNETGSTSAPPSSIHKLAATMGCRAWEGHTKLRTTETSNSRISSPNGSARARSAGFADWASSLRCLLGRKGRV